VKKRIQVYNKQQELTTDINIDNPDFWSLLNKDNMTNALAISIVILVISFCYSGIRQPTASRVSDNPVQKVGAYDKQE